MICQLLFDENPLVDFWVRRWTAKLSAGLGKFQGSLSKTSWLPISEAPYFLGLIFEK